MFKITFNKPAFKMFFMGEDAEGLNIRVEGHRVMFRPVGQIGNEPDVTMITQKDRGGAETIIEGGREAHLFSLLTNPLGNPYFILRRTTGGWMEALPHEGPKHAPERWEPHIRIWPLEMVASGPNKGGAAVSPAYTRGGLPPTEEAREMLRQLEATLSGVAQAPLGRAYSAVHSAQSLVQRFLAYCQENPLPSKKLRKPSVKTLHGEIERKSISPHTLRRQQERVFATV